MFQQIRVLIVEDDEDDAAKIMAEVGDGEFLAQFVHASNREQTLQALGQRGWDIILTDYNLPDMTGLDLLGWVAERKLDVPVIVISGNIGDELAVLTMHAGAHDFISKDSLARLNPAISRELEEQEIHRQRWFAEAALLESEQNFRQLTENLPQVFWLIDCTQKQMLYLSPAFESVWERDASAYLIEPERLLETVHPEDVECLQLALSERGWQGMNTEYRIVLPDESVRWINTRSFPIFDENETVFRVAGLSEDVTERVLLGQDREMMSRALEQTADSVMITDANAHIVYVNPAFEDATGYSRAEALGEKPVILKSGFQDESFYKSMWANILNGIPYTDVFINRRKDGELFYEAKTITPLRNNEGVLTHFVSTGKDITKRLKNQERLNRIVNYDAVTGLANRVLLQDRLNQLVLQCRRQQRGFGIVCIGFELHGLLGEGHGQQLAEQLFRQLAQRLSDLTERPDTVARMENDDFIIVHKEDRDIRGELENLAKKLVGVFAKPIVAEGYELYLTPDIGLSLFPENGEEQEALLENACQAMRYSRTQGHGRYQFFDARLLADGHRLSS